MAVEFSFDPKNSGAQASNLKGSIQLTFQLNLKVGFFGLSTGELNIQQIFLSLEQLYCAPFQLDFT